MCHTSQHSARFPLPRLLLGILFSTIISLLAYCRRSLSRSGIAGAIVAGTTTFGLGGWSWGLSLIFFFVSSSLLSHFRASAKAQTAADKFSKGGQRDLAQVMANGGVAALLALAYGFTHHDAPAPHDDRPPHDAPAPHDDRKGRHYYIRFRSLRSRLFSGCAKRSPYVYSSDDPCGRHGKWGSTVQKSDAHPRLSSLQHLLRAAYAGALATATADTWATELGTLSPQVPRLITNGKPVAPGTSGGITLLGSGAAILGALATGLVFWGLDSIPQILARYPSPHDARMFVQPPPPHDARKGHHYYIRSRLASLVLRRGASAASEPVYSSDAPCGHHGVWQGGTSPKNESSTLERAARDASLPLLALISGLTGCLVDSLLGATWQAMYYCPVCDKETERSVHSCGTRTLPLRGISWLNNDAVNFIATLCGALSAMALHVATMKGNMLAECRGAIHCALSPRPPKPFIHRERAQ